MSETQEEDVKKGKKVLGFGCLGIIVFLVLMGMIDSALGLKDKKSHTEKADIDLKIYENSGSFGYGTNKFYGSFEISGGIGENQEFIIAQNGLKTWDVYSSHGKYGDIFRVILYRISKENIEKTPDFETASRLLSKFDEWIQIAKRNNIQKADPRPVPISPNGMKLYDGRKVEGFTFKIEGNGSCVINMDGVDRCWIFEKDITIFSILNSNIESIKKEFFSKFDSEIKKTQGNNDLFK